MPASLLWLVAAWERPTARGLRRAPTVLAVIVGLTVAQPFGVVASKEERASPPPPTDAPQPGAPSLPEPERSNGEDVHVARLFGLVPVLPFRFYQREIFLSGLGENAPNETLRIRSWFWLPVLTNATEVAEACSGDVFTPCWRPGQQTLTVFREGGTQWATIDNPPGETPVHRLRSRARSPGSSAPESPPPPASPTGSWQRPSSSRTRDGHGAAAPTQSRPGSHRSRLPSLPALAT